MPADLFLLVSPIACMEVYAELAEALHGKHGYGGHVAEIYAYRFQSFSPVLVALPDSQAARDTTREAEGIARAALAALCVRFAESRGARIKIDRLTIRTWARTAKFDHRARVEVLPAPARPERGERGGAGG